MCACVGCLSFANVQERKKTIIITQIEWSTIYEVPINTVNIAISTKLLEISLIFCITTESCLQCKKLYQMHIKQN